MKRILALAIAAVLLLSVTACGGKTDKGGDTQKTEANTAAHITLNGVGLTIGGELTDGMMDKLGEPNEMTEAPNCVEDGAVYDYIYDDFSLQVNRQEDKDTLLEVAITDPNYATDKGVKIGDTAEAVKEAYGTATDDTKYYLVFATDGYDLTFTLSDSVVAEIIYTAIQQ